MTLVTCIQTTARAHDNRSFLSVYVVLRKNHKILILQSPEFVALAVVSNVHAAQDSFKHVSVSPCHTGRYERKGFGAGVAKCPIIRQSPVS